MKVMCVENIKYASLPYAPKEMVIVGHIYTVMEKVSWYGMDWYVLEEMNSGWGWRIDCFIPVTPDKPARYSEFDCLLKKILTVKKLRT